MYRYYKTIRSGTCFIVQFIWLLHYSHWKKVYIHLLCQSGFIHRPQSTNVSHHLVFTPLSSSPPQAFPSLCMMPLLIKVCNWIPTVPIPGASLKVSVYQSVATFYLTGYNVPSVVAPIQTLPFPRWFLCFYSPSLDLPSFVMDFIQR